jgi:hypothetical protein
MPHGRSVLVGAIAVLGLIAAPAGAAGATVNCAGLQGALTGAKAGDVVTLNELCTSGFPYKLPAVPVTLAGTPGAGFNGGKTAQLEGNSVSVTIEGLIFENANNELAGGGGLSVNGAGSPPAVTLVRDSFINDTAKGEGGGARINTATGSVTVTDSTFAGNRANSHGGGLAVFANAASLTGDTFSANNAGPNGLGGGLLLDSGTSTLANSQFSNNTAADGGGGAEITTLAAGGVGVTLRGNTFSHNSVADPGGSSTHATGYLGGGLALQAVGAEPTGLVQSDNTFDSNSVSFKAAPVSAMGAGEAVSRVALQSTGDRFTNNTLQPPSATKNVKAEPVFGWGAGLSVVQCADTIVEPPAAPTVVSTLANAVVAGNTLISGPSANGAGIYVGFACATAYTTLQLSDSTVAGNVVSGASGPVAGISGGPRDVLSLANTIVAGDSGGAELGGFQGLAGVTAAFSDVCSGASPFAGAGNICADPGLVGPGPGSSDVHETTASPTLEAGSNALIPGGLTTDAFGGARVLGPIGCGSSPAPVVDIGAAELAYPAPSCPPPTLLHASVAAAPVLSGLGQTAKTWIQGKLLAHLSSSRGKGKKKLPVGTTFSFKLDQPAHVTFTFTQTARGRRVGKRCVAQTHKNRRKHRCTRTSIAGALGFSAHAGKNKVRFQGLISKRKKLKPGSYKLLVVATASGTRSRTGTLSFTIAR